MSYQTVLYEKKGRIATVTLNQPESLNALSTQLLTDMVAALREAESDDEVRVIILKAAGRAFCAGGNVSPSLPGRSRFLGDVAADRNRISRGVQSWLELWNIRKPIIAQVHGYCITGGTVIAILCDLTIVAEDAKICPEPVAGPLGAGLTAAAWAWRVGPKKAAELCYRIGHVISGKEAVEIGFANKAAPAERLDAEVRALAEEIARTPLDVLTLEKVAITRMQETLGLRAAFLLGAELDAIAHATHPVREFTNRISEVGLRQASREWKEREGYKED